MRRYSWMILFAAALMLLVPSCASIPAESPAASSSPSSGAESTFPATVVEVYDHAVLVAPDADTHVARSADRVVFSYPETFEDGIVLMPGDRVEVVWSGPILESYPARILRVSSLRPLAALDTRPPL